MFNKLLDVIRSIPEVSNLRLLLSESRQRCTALVAENSELKAENERLKSVIETHEREIANLKNSPDDPPRPKQNRLDYDPYKNMHR